MLPGASVNPGIAGMLGRGDLFGPFGAPDALQIQDPYTGAMQGLNVSAGGDFTGRVSAGILALLIIGVGAFYLWTRPHQA